MSMTLQEMAKSCGEDSRRWFPSTSNDLVFLTLAMNGEAGELANVVKKVARGSTSMSDPKVRLQIMQELMDTMIYAMCIADALHIDIEKLYLKVRSDNAGRFNS